MNMKTKRLVQSLLLTGGLCACAGSNQQRAEDPAELSAPRAERDNATPLGQMTPVVPQNDYPGEPGSGSPMSDGPTMASDVPGAVPGSSLPPVAPIEPMGSSDRTAAMSDDAVAARDGTAAAPDNTAVNKRDRNDKKLTPGDQGTSKRDIEITRRIRETVVDDSSLSFSARNVKIITVDGRVTLRGPVASQTERASIEKKALAVAGDGQVVNEIEIKN